MNRDQITRKFKQGVVLCRNGKLVEASTLFQQIIATGSEEPLHLSYHGLILATAHGRRREGLQLCQRAMTFDPAEPEVVLNLARLHEISGQKLQAIETLRRGLRANPEQPRLMKQIERLSPRKRPPLSMVDRDNAVNKQLAIMLARMTGRRGKSSGKATPMPGQALRMAK